MNAYRQSICVKCEHTIQVGDPIRKQFVRAGFRDDGRPIFQATDKYIHTKCKKAKAPIYDPETGERL